MATTTAPSHVTTPPAIRPPVKPNLVFEEIMRFAYDTFCTNKIRFVLTALGMVIGTASLILVVTIGLTGKQYILGQIQGIGANMIVVDYSGASSASTSTAPQDLLTMNDLRAVREQVPGVRAASPMVEIHDRIPIAGGKERDVLILGVSVEYAEVRNLVILSGRFFDEDDTAARNKVAVITYKLANKLYGSPQAAIGHTVKLSGLPFTIIGAIRERVETFGQSEIADDTFLIPYTVARYYTGDDYAKQLFFSMADSSDVPRATEQIRRVVQSRHRPESVYRAENLTQLLDVAGKTANALTAVLLLISLVTLIVSGVGIMNIMLATVSSRIREIGVRKAVGATNREIKYQFLAEAMFISLSGGMIGILIGLALPFSVRFLTNFRIPISGLSAIIAILVSTVVGVLFGTVPATRAAQLDPVESLRWE
ncbi:MAG TPA: ABC transporter permease [Terriglobales bacterium]|nr:ABC transporter permease [Terriglobales bacterium]